MAQQKVVKNHILYYAIGLYQAVSQPENVQ